MRWQGRLEPARLVRGTPMWDDIAASCGLVAACCGEEVQGGEAVLVRRHLTLLLVLHLSCLQAAVERAPADLLDIRSANELRRLLVN